MRVARAGLNGKSIEIRRTADNLDGHARIAAVGGMTPGAVLIPGLIAALSVR